MGVFSKNRKNRLSLIENFPKGNPRHSFLGS
jgi:hypothetical protein